MKKNIILVAIVIFLSALGNQAFASVSYLGPAGTYTEDAALQFFGHKEKVIPAVTVVEALAMLKEGKCQYTVVPVENTIGGPAYSYLEAALADDSFAVVGEVDLPIRQTLLANDLQDTNSNVTRFWVVTLKTKQLDSKNKVIALVRGPINSMAKLLSELDEKGFRIQTLHDLPVKTRLGEYQFVIEVLGYNPQFTLENIFAQPELQLQGRILGSFNSK